MIEAIIEVWCSPMRQENYSVKIIPLCAGYADHMEEDIKEYLGWDFYLNTFGVDYSEVRGLWKVVSRVSVSWIYTNDWEGVPDCDVDIGQEDLFKGKCYDWSEMKHVWLDLNGKTEEYYNKPWKKQFWE